MGLPLVTKEEYKAYAGITSPTTDTKIDLLITKVSALVKTICKRTFVDHVDTSKTEYHNGGTKYLVLEESPITTVVSVEYSIDNGLTYMLYTNGIEAVYDKSADRITYLLGTEFPYRVNGYRVVYFAGFPVLPEDLKLAVLDLISYYMKNDSAVHSSRAPGTTVQVEYVTNTNLPAHIKRVLDLYTDSYV